MTNTSVWVSITLIASLFGLVVYTNLSELGHAVSARWNKQYFRSALLEAAGAKIPAIGSTVFAPDIGDITLTALLGKGRFSWVMKGEANEKTYAVKFRNTNAAQSQILQEVKVLSALHSSEGFPRVYSTDAGKKFFVMEFLEGYVSLDKKRREDASPLSVSQLTTQLISRLEDVHKAGFVYGDIHKRNIFVNMADPNAPVKVSDFALSSLAASSNDPPTILNLYLGSVSEQERLPLRPIDDVERLTFVLIDFLYKSRLLWIGTYNYRENLKYLNSADKTKAAIADLMILNAKIHLPDNEAYFVNHGIHKGFQNMLRYVREYRKQNDAIPIQYDVLRAFFEDQPL